MAIDSRKKDINWNVTDSDRRVTYEQAQLAVLMDIRDELKRMNGVLNCPNFLAIPDILRRVRGNTSRIKLEGK